MHAQDDPTPTAKYRQHAHIREQLMQSRRNQGIPTFLHLWRATWGVGTPCHCHPLQALAARQLPLRRHFRGRTLRLGISILGQQQWRRRFWRQVQRGCWLGILSLFPVNVFFGAALASVACRLHSISPGHQVTEKLALNSPGFRTIRLVWGIGREQAECHAAWFVIAKWGIAAFCDNFYIRVIGVADWMGWWSVASSAIFRSVLFGGLWLQVKKKVWKTSQPQVGWVVVVYFLDQYECLW